MPCVARPALSLPPLQAWGSSQELCQPVAMAVPAQSGVFVPQKSRLPALEDGERGSA